MPTSPPLDVRALRERFPALQRVAPDGRRYLHTDAPGGTQVLDAVIEAMAEYLQSCNANSHGVFITSQETEALSEQVRRAAAAFLGGEGEGVVFGANMTTLTWHFSHALTDRFGANDEIVCTELDHDANVTPWLALARRTGARVRWVRLDTASGTLDLDTLEEVVTPRTRLIAFPAASNALGTLVDPAPFVAAAARVGALTYLDAVHAAPHVPLSRHATGVTVLACSPYKFFGPHAGLLLADPAVLAELTPDKVRPSPDAGPERWQTGTASFEAIAGVGAALQYLQSLGMQRVQAHEQLLSQRFLAGLDELPRVRLYGPRAVRLRTPTFALTIDGHTPRDVVLRLAEEGIFAWAGHYYAVEPMRALGLLEAGGAVRIGFVHYHDLEDVERVLDALGGV